MKCTSCSKNVLSENNFSKFKCISCLKGEIIRCEDCRRRSNEYTCPVCGYKGP